MSRFSIYSYCKAEEFGSTFSVQTQINVLRERLDRSPDTEYYYDYQGFPSIDGLASYSIQHTDRDQGVVYYNIVRGKVGWITKGPLEGVVYNTKGELVTLPPKPASQLWPRTEAILKVAPRVLLYGKPGTGKTTAAFMVDPENTYKTTVHEESSAAELIGHFMPNGAGKFTWHDGIGVAAWREGKRLLIDEIDKAGGDFQTAMYAIADDPQVARLRLPTGEIVKPAPGFQVVLTMNGTPKDLPSALRDRFSVALEINEPNPHALASLSEAVRGLVLSTMRQADEERSVSVRAMKAFDELEREGLDRETAAWAVLGPRAKDFLRALDLQKA